MNWILVTDLESTGRKMAAEYANGDDLTLSLSGICWFQIATKDPLFLEATSETRGAGTAMVISDSGMSSQHNRSWETRVPAPDLPLILDPNIISAGVIIIMITLL